MSLSGLKALDSAVYRPEAALAVLLPVGAAGLAYIVPITATIICPAVPVFLVPADG